MPAGLVLVILLAVPLQPAAGAPAAPTGLTAFALDGQVALAWKAAAGATSYQVLRSTTSGGSGTQIATPSAASFKDTTAANATTYYYTVKAVNGTASPASDQAQATPRARTCSAGNAVVVENCFPGTTAWKLQDLSGAFNGGIEGFATESSINRGQSVDLKVNAQWSVPYRIEIYRSGWYGGSQGRLVSVLPGREGVQQGSCDGGNGNTGLHDCSAWDVTDTVTTTSDWAPGIYLLRLVRTDTGGDSHILLTVRDDAASPDAVYLLPTSTYQAYNNYGGKSLYDYSSIGANTVSGTRRAVKVSFDRPYDQGQRDWYTGEDVRNLAWLEREGYNLGYATSLDQHTGTANLNGRKAIISAAHDEYWSSQMRTAVTNARNAGTGLLFLGANAVYWRVRFENSLSGTPNRVLVGYKSTESGPADPSGTPTGTWRDPAGANNPENSLIGEQYIGQSTSGNFPLVVSGAQGKHRLWRYTSLGDLATGAVQAVGSQLVGWEWDARAANGAEPAGVSTVAASNVTGDILQDAGKVYAPGSAVQQSTYYKAPGSGGVVFATGTNNWSRGLGNNAVGVGEPNSTIMQATANALADMNAKPTTPVNVTVDGTSAPSVTGRTPAPGAIGIQMASKVTATFAQAPDPSTVTTSSFTLTGPGGASVPASVALDATVGTATLTPTSALSVSTTYTATLTTAIKAWNGTALGSNITWSFTTASGPPPTVTGRTPASGATNVSFTATPSATFDRAIDPATLTSSSFTLTPSGATAVQATVAYDASSKTATLTPSAVLLASTVYTARLTTDVTAPDGSGMASETTWKFTTKETPPPLTVTSRSPAPLSTGISPATNVRAVLSRSIDPATLTSSTFKLVRNGGPAVQAVLSYDDATRTATLTPSAPLSDQVSYTATVTTGLHADDGTPLTADVSWSFTTAFSAPPAPAVISTSPLAGDTVASAQSVVKATFDRAMDRATFTNQTFTLKAGAAAPVLAAISYDSTTNTATLIPDAPLVAGTQYTARVTTNARSAAGAPLATDMTWTFTVTECPCQLFASTAAPNDQYLGSADGHGASTYELGVRFTVDTPVDVTSVRFFKSPWETGTHVGRLWSSNGTLLASATYQNETAGGWQKQKLASPVTLQPGNVYTASVGINAWWARTFDGLSSTVSAGPLHTVADGGNGVYGNQAGDFPNGSYGNSNYFVDVVVDTAGQSAAVPHVVGEQPGDGADGVGQLATVKATFDTPIDPATVTASSFSLKTGATSVAASVSYDPATWTATLTPNGALAQQKTYIATVSAAVHSGSGVPLAAPVTWSFVTESQSAPGVLATTPTAGASQISPAYPIKATFSQPMTASTLNATTFVLRTSDGSPVPASVSYSSATQTATLTPTTALAVSTDYVATITAGAKNSDGVAMASQRVWTFTTSACPCRLFADSVNPSGTQLATQDGRSGSGPWSYELGTKFKVTSPARLTSVRYFKSAGETGTHIGRLWNASGTQLATVTFTGETGSGWQGQAFGTPVDLSPGQTYIVSVGFNAFFSMTANALASEIAHGPLHSIADGANGVYGQAVGQFPTATWSNSSYLVDPVVG